MKNKILLTLLMLLTTSPLLFSQYVTGDIRANSQGAWNAYTFASETEWEEYKWNLSGGGFNEWVSIEAPATVNTNVYLNFPVKIGGSHAVPTMGAGKIIIEPGASLEILKTGFINTDSTKIVIKANSTEVGSLKVYAGETAAATQNIYLSQNTWHLIGSPFIYTDTSSFTGIYMQQYNEADNTWIWNDSTGVFPTTLTRGHGYSAWRDAAADTTYTMSGISYSIDVNINLPFTLVDSVHKNGFTMLSNPFTCGLQYHVAWDMTGLSDIISVWNSVTKSYDEHIPSEGHVIPAGSGFFIKANSTGQSITLPADHRELSYLNPLKRESEDLISFAKLRVNNINNSYADAITFRFANDANLNYNADIDFPKMYGSDQGPHLFMLTENNIPVSVKSFDAIQTSTMRMQLRPNVDATYRITASEFTFDPTTEVLLEDLFTETIVPVNASLDYTFTSQATDDESRFVIYVRPAVTDIDTPEAESQFTVFGTKDQLRILSSESNYKLCVYNLLGQKLVEKNKLEGNASIDLSAFKQAIVLVSIQSENEFISKKIQLK